MIPYGHGGDIYRNKIELDYSANINPLGLPESVREALHRAVEESCRYPDSRSEALREALAARHGVSREQVICANGAADLIFQAAGALKPARAVVLAPTFSEYRQALEAAGSEVEEYRLPGDRDFAPDMGGILRYLEEREGQIGLLFFCNPNNPTGLAVPEGEMIRLADCCMECGIFLAVDECFCDFLEEPEVYSMTPHVSRYPNLLIIRAFTKLYAMAGVRLGYGICREEALLDKIRLLRQPWSVSNLAQAAGLAALGEEAYVKRTRELIGAERLYLKEQLAELGFYVYPSMANYVFFRDDCRERNLYELCLERGVLIRSCANYGGLDSRYYRICVKTRAENERFLEILRRITEA